MKRRAVATGAGLGLVLAALGLACRTPPPPDVPPPTAARPSGLPVWSGPVTHPHLTAPGTPPAADAGTSPEAGAPSAASMPAVHAGNVEVRFVAPGTTLEGKPCTRFAITTVKGALALEIGGPAPTGVVLSRGDTVVVTHPHAVAVRGLGLGVVARYPVGSACSADDAPKTERTIVRVNTAPSHTWGHGGMRADLTLGAAVSPELYLGRLEGTLPVAEHVHAGSYEVLAALEGAGTFTVDGREQRLGPDQLVVVPPNAKHAYRPDPGSKLVAVQIYTPPGPEQRFAGLAAAERDAGAPPHARDAGARP